MKRKITYLASTLRTTGPTNQLYAIIQYLDKQRFDAQIITLSPEPEHTQLPRFQKLGLPITSLNLSRWNGLIKAKEQLKKIFRTDPPDLIHSQGIRSDRLVEKLDLKIPSVKTIRTYPQDDYRLKFGVFLGTIMSISHLNLVKKSVNVVACSESLAQRFRQEKNIQLNFIANGVDNTYFKKASPDHKSGLRRKLGIDDSKFVFIVIGNLVALKDISSIIHVFKENDFGGRAVLIIAGDGPQETHLKALAGENAHIRFVGRVKNALDYYQASDFFISASLSEGLPNAVMEAMACGLPVILSKLPAHMEIMKTIEPYPYFFNFKDVQGIRNKIMQIIDDNYPLLSEKMLHVINTNFTSKIMSEKYQNLYTKLIEHGTAI